MKTWTLFSKDKVLRRVEGFEPLVAQWEKGTHPAQIRLHKYLDWLTKNLSPLPGEPNGLFLHLEIDVHNPGRLLRHNDLENYLTPLFGRRWLGHEKFVLVSATKKVGGGSYVEIGSVRPLPGNYYDDDWESFECSPEVGTSTKQWKEILWLFLESTQPRPLPSGPVEVHLAWRCSPQRNWVNLWKATGDVMGPILGYASKSNRFHPNDDRIVSLSLHKCLDPSLVHSVDVGMWWHRKPNGTQT